MKSSTTMLMVLLLLPSTVRALPEEKARDLFGQGKIAYNEARYPEALASFKGALKLVHRASLLLMTARTYRRLNRADKALTYYESYKSVWRQENPGKPSPHAAEVAEQLGKLAKTTRLVDEAEAHLREGMELEALATLNLALKGSSWPRIYAVLARCYLALDRPDKAHASLKVALGYWEGFRLGWKTRNPGSVAPDDEHAASRVTALKALEQAIQQHGKPTEPATQEPAPAPTPPPAHGPDPPVKEPAPEAQPGQRSTMLLGLGITAIALAVASEALAWAAYAEAPSHFEWEDNYTKYRNLYVAGHVTAAAMAITSGVLFYFWYKSGEPVPAHAAALSVLPLPGGAAVTGGFRF